MSTIEIIILGTIFTYLGLVVILITLAAIRIEYVNALTNRGVNVKYLFGSRDAEWDFLTNLALSNILYIPYLILKLLYKGISRLIKYLIDKRAEKLLASKRVD